MNRLIGSSLLALAVAVSACSAGGTSSDTRQQTPDTSSPPATVAETSTTTVPATSTTVTTTTVAETTTTVDGTLVHGFPVEEGWVVETIVTGIDAGTGGLAVAEDGTFFMGDFGYTDHPGNTLLRITPEGEISPFATHEDMDQLTMTRFAADGSILQSSYGSGFLFRIDGDGNAEVVADKLRGPTGMVELDDGTLVVEEYNARRLSKILLDGTVEVWVEDIRMAGPNGIAIDPDGTIYVIDHKDGALWGVSPDGEITKLMQFPRATSHGVYHDGSVFVTSRNGYAIIRYDIASGDATVIAGTGLEGEDDGPALEASFGRLNAITVGPDGALYVNHGGEEGITPVSIRRIARTP